MAQEFKRSLEKVQSDRPTRRSMSAEQREFIECLKRLYKADHQAEYLYIQAEVDSLCIQLEQAKALQKATA